MPTLLTQKTILIEHSTQHPATMSSTTLDLTENNDSGVIPTRCSDWSLTCDKASSKRFWWNTPYSISVWEDSLDLSSKSAVGELTDDKVWNAYLRFQLKSVYKQCGVCHGPETSVDMGLCCYCGSPVHWTTCAIAATADQIAWKAGNKGIPKEKLLVCRNCDDLADPGIAITPHVDNARRCLIRALSIEHEYPLHIKSTLHRLLKSAEKSPDDPDLLRRTIEVVSMHFQPHDSADFVERRFVQSKDGFGVIAKRFIPKFTVVGVYPGYDDPLSGEHAKKGRPGPKYSLVDMNCADYFNRVFTEFSMCITPFFNEPSPTEVSNTGWIQETCRPEGRLSVMTSRDIQPGEELMIGYGPMYPRTYPHNYDALAFHRVEDVADPICFSLWHWTSLNEADAKFVCYVAYDPSADEYVPWETQKDSSPIASPFASPRSTDTPNPK